MRRVVIVLIYCIAPMLMVRVLLGVSRDMKENDVLKVRTHNTRAKMTELYYLNRIIQNSQKQLILFSR